MDLIKYKIKKYETKLKLLQMKGGMNLKINDLVKFSGIKPSNSDIVTVNDVFLDFAEKMNIKRSDSDIDKIGRITSIDCMPFMYTIKEGSQQQGQNLIIFDIFIYFLFIFIFPPISYSKCFYISILVICQC